MLAIPRREANRSIPVTHEVASMDRRSSIWTARVVKQVQKESPPLLGSSANGDVKWAKVIDTAVGLGKRLLYKSFYWEFSCDGLSSGSA